MKQRASPGRSRAESHVADLLMHRALAFVGAVTLIVHSLYGDFHESGAPLSTLKSIACIDILDDVVRVMTVQIPLPAEYHVSLSCQTHTDVSRNTMSQPQSDTKAQVISTYHDHPQFCCAKCSATIVRSRVFSVCTEPQLR